MFSAKLSNPCKWIMANTRGFTHIGVRMFSMCSAPLQFRISQNLFAEPLKKKKRIDPAVIKAREERRRKRIEKQIRRLEKNSSQLKPIDECEIPLEIVNERKARMRGTVSRADETQINEVIHLMKNWTAYRNKQHMQDVKMIDRILYSQQWALDQLKHESPELYESAIQVDEDLFPFTFTGPVETPSIDKYDSPDGEFIDVSKKWDD